MQAHNTHRQPKIVVSDTDEMFKTLQLQNQTASNKVNNELLTFAAKPAAPAPKLRQNELAHTEIF